MRTDTQAPYEFEDQADLDANFASIPDRTRYSVRKPDGVYEYRKVNNQSFQLRPDPMLLGALQSTDTSLQGQITAINTSLDQINASFQNFQPLWASILNKPNFHAVATSGSYNDLINKPTIPAITAGAAITNNATNAPTDARTDYGLVAAILGADVNATNSKQNATATVVNSLAVKFNTLLATLRANGIIAP